MPKTPDHTIADINHALAVVADYILQTGFDNVWPIIERLEAEKRQLETRDDRLKSYVQQGKSALNIAKNPSNIVKLHKA